MKDSSGCLGFRENLEAAGARQHDGPVMMPRAVGADSGRSDYLGCCRRGVRHEKGVRSAGQAGDSQGQRQQNAAEDRCVDRFCHGQHEEVRFSFLWSDILRDAGMVRS